MLLVLLVGLACLVTGIFFTSYYWQGEWMIGHTGDRGIRLLSNHGGFALQRIDQPDANGLQVVYPAIFGMSYAFVALFFVAGAIWRGLHVFKRAAQPLSLP